MSRPKIYKINEEYFNTEMNEHQAYLLGLIMSDSHLNYDRGRFEHCCATRDVSIIEFIKSEFSSTHPIKTIIINKTPYNRYGITNKKLVQSIINKFNLPHLNKSINNIEIPLELDNAYINHFLRGFFDGDGSIWYGGGTYRSSYTGGEKMMKSIQSILTKINIPSYLSYRYGKENKNSCNITINGTFHTEKLGRFLYENATCFLKRKHVKFLKCYSQAEHVKNRSLLLSGNEEKSKELYISGMSQANIARKLNLPMSSIRCCIQRLRRKNQLI